MRSSVPLLLGVFQLSLLVSTGASGRVTTAFEAYFNRKVRPFISDSCVSCHGGDKPEAELDLSTIKDIRTLLKDDSLWTVMLERMEAGEMPPADARRQPAEKTRDEALGWFRAVQADQIRRNSGDPGLVFARRLSAAAFDYSIRDLTGVDIKPAREFPVDPSNIAGFDNSGESLTMSPALLHKYLHAAREVASHLYLRESGIGFASHPMLSESDRDKSPSSKLSISTGDKTSTMPTTFRPRGASAIALRWGV